MMNQDFLLNDVEKLIILKNKGIRIGLHLEFGAAEGFIQKIKHLFFHLNGINDARESYYLEIASQYDKFVKLLSFIPDHIDGHRHLHQLPIISEALVLFLRNRNCLPLLVRNSSIPISCLVSINHPTFVVKGIILTLMGNYFKLKLRRYNINTNNYLLGGYPFSSSINLSSVYKKYLKKMNREDDVFFVHPSVNDKSQHVQKSIASRRYQEYLWLKEFDWNSNSAT